MADFKQFGWTDGCPRCLDLQAGAFQSKRNHTQECRLRMYLHFREANHHKWRKVKHLVEPEPDAPFRKDHIDLEGAQPSVIPGALDGRNVFEHSESHEPDLEQDQAPAMEGIYVDDEQLQAREAAGVGFADEEAIMD